jgi:protein SCO1/2
MSTQPQSSQRRQYRIATIAFAVIALCLGLWSFHQKSPEDSMIELENGTPHDISPFHLVSADTTDFTNANLKGKWSFLFFGFTKCPELCPTTLTTLNKMVALLTEHKVEHMPQVVFISLDPARDTPSTMKNYLASFNKNFVGATGSEDSLKKLTSEFSVLYAKVAKNAAQDDYVIDHSGTLLLVNPNAQLVAVFSTPHDATKLSHDLRTIEANYHA